MADHVGELDDVDTSFELFDDKGVAEIVDLGARDTSDAEVAIDGGTDVADQERIASLGDEKSSIFGFGAFFDIFFDGGLGSTIEWNFAGIVTLVGADFEMRLFERDVLKLETGELTDTETSLEKEFNNAIHTDIVFDTVAEGAILKGREDTSRSNFVFGMRDGSGRGGSHTTFTYQIFKERFDGVELAGDTLERIFIVFEALFELLEMIRSNIFGFGDPHTTQKNQELVEVFGIG